MTVALVTGSAACGEASPSDADPTLERAAGAYATVLEARPYPPVERLGPEPFQRSLEDKRWFHARRVGERHLPLLRRIKAGEIGDFGGVEWRWSEAPENAGLGRLTGVLYFLRSPDRTLAATPEIPCSGPLRATSREPTSSASHEGGPSASARAPGPCSAT
jgi:hypothetical protein